MQKAEVQVRRLIRAHHKPILSLDSLVFYDSWGPNDINGRSGFVAEIEDAKGVSSLAGFCVTIQMSDHVLIKRIAVHPDLHRQGIGTTLIDSAKALCNSNRKFVRLEASEANLPGHMFLKANGFRATARQRDGIYRFTYYDRSQPLDPPKHRMKGLTS